MSVPSHNLYDFVHQATEKRYWLLTFHPWGNKEFTGLNDYQHDCPHGINGPNGIPSELRVIDQLLPNNSLKLPYLSQVAQFQPVLLCNDQEPLYFDHYQGSLLDDVQPNLNLRSRIPTSWQKKWILLHSEVNSHELNNYEQTGQYVGAYWWSHAIIALDWYRYAQHDTSLCHGNFDKLFLIYARDSTGTRQYRAEFLSMINDLSTACQIGSVNGEPATANHSAVYDSGDFNHTAFSIVLETLFDDQRIQLTEKILRPIACGHPFILAAGAGSLQLLKRYGFETFSPWVNEAYDSISNSKDRLTAIVDEMRRISKLPLDQQQTIVDQCRVIAQRNQRRFFSADFFNTITAELKENVAQAWDKCQGHFGPDFYLQIIRWRRKNCPGWFTEDKRENLRLNLQLARRLRSST